MKKVFLMLFCVLFVLSIIGCVQPKTQTDETPPADGEKLVRDLWSEIKLNNRETFENKLADGFQSIHEDGARDKASEIELLMGLDLGDYILADFKTTQSGNIVIVTYTVSVKETIEGEILPTEPAERLSVFIKTDKGWQWIAHANLNPMKKKES